MILILVSCAGAGLWAALMLTPWRRLPELGRRARKPSPSRTSRPTTHKRTHN